MELRFRADLLELGRVFEAGQMAGRTLSRHQGFQQAGKKQISIANACSSEPHYLYLCPQASPSNNLWGIAGGTLGLSSDCPELSSVCLGFSRVRLGFFSVWLRLYGGSGLLHQSLWSTVSATDSAVSY